jgi:hypothetical protein
VTQQSKTFWEPLMKACYEAEGFTTHFYLRGLPAPIEMSHLPPYDGQITGTALISQNEMTILMDDVMAYEIEES